MNTENSGQQAAMNSLQSEWLFSLYLDIGFDHVQKIGATPGGWRGIYPVYGGTFHGTRLRGTVLPSGSDWVTRRSDGVTELDVRIGLLTDDGETIAMSYQGLFHISDVAAERQSRGETVGYEESYVRTTPRFSTSAPRYDWLNRIVAVGNGGPRGSSPTYEVFAIL